MTTKRRPRTAPARKRAAAPTRTRRRMARGRKALELEGLPAGDIEALRAELERNLPPAGAARWNVDPEDVQRSVAKLVLTLMEFLRKLLERQAIRRMEARTLTPAEVEAVGLALMRLEETLRVMGERFGLTADDLNLDLGPLGRLI
jgi:Gas vesicle protein K